MAFLGGSTGIIYRQFSVTIVAAMALSVLWCDGADAALCATMLKPIGHGPTRPTPASSAGSTAFDRSNARYQGGVRGILSRSRRFMLCSPPWWG